jgi:hypothetical protein
MRCEFCAGEISDAAVLSHAARLHARKRKSFKGAPPQEHKCPRCGETFMGKRSLFAHLALCASPPMQPLDELEPVTEDELKAMRWTPEGEA